jgi:hypothetical protein
MVDFSVGVGSAVDVRVSVDPIVTVGRLVGVGVSVDWIMVGMLGDDIGVCCPIWVNAVRVKATLVATDPLPGPGVPRFGILHDVRKVINKMDTISRRQLGSLFVWQDGHLGELTIFIEFSTLTNGVIFFEMISLEPGSFFQIIGLSETEHL